MIAVQRAGNQCGDISREKAIFKDRLLMRLISDGLVKIGPVVLQVYKVGKLQIGSHEFHD